MSKYFFRSLFLLVTLNLLVKPVWIFAIDRQVQNIAGFSEYGHYFALLNLCIILNFTLDLGISSFFNREVASGKENGVSLFSQALSGKMVLSIFYTILTISVAIITGINDYTLLLMLVLMQVGSSLLLFLRSFLTATQHFKSDAVVSIMDKLFVIIVAGIMIFFPSVIGGITVYKFVLIQVAGIGLSVLMSVFFLMRNVSGFSLRPFPGFNKEIILATLPFALNIFFMSLMSRADGFLLEYMLPNGAEQAGIYAAAFRLLDAFNMVGFLMAGFLLPFIARNWPNVNRFSAVLLNCRHMLVMGSMIVVGFAFASPDFIANLLYHKKDAYLSQIIMIVLFALPGLSMIHIYGTALTATRNMNIFLRLSVFFALLSFILNLIFIPRYGAMASAVIAACVQSMYSLSVIYFARMKTGIRLAIAFIPLYAAGGLLFFSIVKTADYFGWNILLSAAIASIIIAAIFFYRAGGTISQVVKIFEEKR